jgi:hypothetical protein
MLRGLFGGRKRSVGKQGEKLPEKHDGLPDSTLAYGLCPRCEKQSSFDIGGTLPITFNPDSYSVSHDGTETPVHVDQVSVLYCRSCRQGIVAVEEQRVGDHSWREEEQGHEGVLTWRGIHWWPAADAHVSGDVPSEIAQVFQEAVRAMHADCPRAAAVMARRTLEAMTVDKGVTKGTLADRLNGLAAKGVLLPTLADWSKEVRLVGNTGAHFDPIGSVSKEDAEDLISFVRELLRYLYELPADLSRRRGP